MYRMFGDLYESWIGFQAKVRACIRSGQLSIVLMETSTGLLLKWTTKSPKASRLQRGDSLKAKAKPSRNNVGEYQAVRCLNWQEAPIHCGFSRR